MIPREGDGWACVALGSNLGDSAGLLRSAMDCLQGWSDRPARCSGLYESSPVDCPPGSPRFLNAVVALQPRPDDTPEAWLDRLQAIEREFGRKPKQVANEARPLDLDLVMFGRERRSGPRLVLPHPRAHLRRFVLTPLAEIAPALVLPGQSVSVAVLLERLPAGEDVRLLA
jgi:2-amino-4-hydroxy-6-hydroxymethyldihydropteridine diphosphokinase